MLSQGKAEQAKAYYHQAIKMDADHWKAWQALGTVCIEMGETSEALAAFMASLKINPDNQPLRDYMKSLQGSAVGGKEQQAKAAEVSAPVAEAMPPPLKRPEKRKPLAAKKWQKLKRWVLEMLLESLKKGKKKKEVCYQWSGQPSLSVIGGSADQKKIVKWAVRRINDALQGTRMQIVQKPDDDSTADIIVHITYAIDFDLAAKKYGFQMAGYSEFGVSMKWYKPDQCFISKAVVFVSQEKDEDMMRHISLAGIAKTLGLRHKPPLAPMEDSVFRLYSIRELMTRFSRDDKNLLKFYYTYVKPCTEKKELEDLFEKYYPEVLPE